MTATRILHVSDIHIGSRGVDELVAPLAALIEAERPELVIASGDLTHRGRPDQHSRAAAFLKALSPTVLAIPLAAVLATLVDVIVLDKDPAEEEVPTVIFSAKDAE